MSALLEDRSIETTETTRCGYIALIGRPNAGKSTLLNAMVGQKLAGVSRKPQTTRNRILGVVQEGDAQLLFLDSPGMHKTRGSLLNRVLNRVAWQVADDADLVVYLVDGATGLTDTDQAYLKKLAESSTQILVLLSKADSQGKAKTRTQLAELNLWIADQMPAGRVVGTDAAAFSAKRPEELAALRNRLASLLPEGPWFFGDDELTDVSERFVCAELIREQLFRQLGNEIPYSCTVRVDSIGPGGDLTRVRGAIIVERANHKGMVIGRGGSKLREIGQAARVSLERHFDQKVFLDLQVETQNGWTHDAALLAELTQIDPDSIQL